MAEICPACGQAIRKKRWQPPSLEEVKAYRAANPELANVDAYTFWVSYTKSDWMDTAGKPIRNWKLKMWTWSKHSEPAKANYEAPKEKFVMAVCAECPHRADIKVGNKWYCYKHAKGKVAPPASPVQQLINRTAQALSSGPGPLGAGLTSKTAAEQVKALRVK